MTSNRHKILIVDDEPANISILENIFEENFETQAASSGEEALSVIEDFSPDIVLLDIMMPDLDGYEICRRIRENKNLRFSKIIFVSAKQQTEDRLAGYELGADDYIVKPFDDDEILAKVRIFLRLKYVEEIDQIKNEFLNMFVKEKNTPLREILGFASMLKKSNLSYADQVSVDEIMERGHYLWELSEKTRYLCKLKKVTYLLKKRCEIDLMLSKVVEETEAKYKEKEISLNINNKIKTSIPLDAIAFSKGLSYVMDNAIQYAPKHSEITISCEKLSDQCSIKIQDQGQQFETGDKNKIFDEFITPKLGNGQRYGGINLAIAKQIAILHHGDFKVDNNQEQGVTFEFNFPRATVATE